MSVKHTQNSSDLAQAKRFVNNAKSRLKRKLKKRGKHNSFGKKEVRAFRDKFNYNDTQIRKLMTEFMNWCRERRE